MKLLDEASDRAATENCAGAVLEVVPLVMRTIRAELRKHGSAELSVAQFRTLAYLNQRPGASLSELADQIGLSLPSMSKLVDGLVARELVTRREDTADRRRVVLCLTEYGQATVRKSLAATQAYLALLLGRLPEEHRSTVTQAMAFLETVFTNDLTGEVK